VRPQQPGDLSLALITQRRQRRRNFTQRLGAIRLRGCVFQLIVETAALELADQPFDAKNEFVQIVRGRNFVRSTQFLRGARVVIEARVTDSRFEMVVCPDGWAPYPPREPTRVHATART